MHRSELQGAKPVTRLMPPLAFALALPWPLIGFGAWLGYQLVRQHGRPLLRLEALEQGLKALQAQPARPTPAPTAPATPQRPAAGLQEDPFVSATGKGNRTLL